MRLELHAPHRHGQPHDEVTELLLTDGALGVVSLLSGYGPGAQVEPALENAQAAIRGLFARLETDPSMALPLPVDPGQDPSARALSVALQLAHARLSNAPGGEVAATGLALRIQGDQLAVAWAGHARLSLWRHGIFHPVTLDHTPANEPEAPFFVDLPDGTAVSRALGLPSGCTPDLGLRSLFGGDILVVGTSALLQALPSDELGALLSTDPLDELHRRIAAAAAQRGYAGPFALLRLHDEA